MPTSKKQITSISSESIFLKKIQQPTLVIFKTNWSGEAYLVSEVLQHLWEEEDSYELGMVDVEELPILKDRYNISEIPTVLFFLDAKVVDNIVGLLPTEEVKSHIATFLENIRTYQPT